MIAINGFLMFTHVVNRSWWLPLHANIEHTSYLHMLLLTNIINRWLDFSSELCLMALHEYSMAEYLCHK